MHSNCFKWKARLYSLQSDIVKIRSINPFSQVLIYLSYFLIHSQRQTLYFTCINVLPSHICIETACLPDAHNSLNTVRGAPGTGAEDL